jgi:hypothetical protein
LNRKAGTAAQQILLERSRTHDNFRELVSGAKPILPEVEGKSPMKKGAILEAQTHDYRRNDNTNMDGEEAARDHVKAMVRQAEIEQRFVQYGQERLKIFNRD